MKTSIYDPHCYLDDDNIEVYQKKVRSNEPDVSYRRVTKKDERIFTCPHYLHDPDYKSPKVVYGKYGKVDDCEYSDRLSEWDYDKNKRSFEKAKGKEGTADYYESYLSNYFEKPVSLIFMLAGFNLSNGYPYVVYGFNFKK